MCLAVPRRPLLRRSSVCRRDSADHAQGVAGRAPVRPFDLQRSTACAARAASVLRDAAVLLRVEWWSVPLVAAQASCTRGPKTIRCAAVHSLPTFAIGATKQRTRLRKAA